jgi:hypothetical protein
LVNENAKIRDKLRIDIDNEISKRRPKNYTTKDLFNQCCERDNAIFNEVKEFFTQNK